MKRFDLKLIVPALVLVGALVALVMGNLQTVKNVVDDVYGSIAGNLSWLFILADLAALAFAAWAVFGRCAKVRFGGPQARPDFSTFSWLAIMFTTNCSAGLILFGFIEPLSYVSAPPFQIEPFSEAAYEYAQTYVHFHWGLNDWGLIVPAAVAVSILIYNRGSRHVTLSAACGASPKGVVSRVVDVVALLAVIVAPVTSMGLGMPMLVLLLERAFGIPAAYEGVLQIAVLLVWMALFGASVFLGLRKGIKNLSDINVGLALVFMVFVGVLAGVFYVFKAEINTLGLYVSNLVRMSTYTDPYGTGEFVSSWTIWYWAWTVVYMPLMGVITARVSKGRTVRQVVLGLTICGSAGCWFAMATLGNYSLEIQRQGIADLCAVLAQEGQAPAILAVLETMPFPAVVMVVLAVLCFIFMATTVDSSSYVAAEMTTVHEGSDDQAPRSLRLLWAAVACVLTATLLAVGGFSAVQTLALLAGLPLALVVFFLIASAAKMLKKERELQAVSEGDVAEEGRPSRP